MEPEFDTNQSTVHNQSDSKCDEQRFDYEDLDNESKTVVLECTAQIKKLMRRSAEDTINIGKSLLKVKESLKHGDFENWLKTEFDWGFWTARKFMQVAEQFSSVNFTDLSIVNSALFILAAPSVSEEARIEAFERARQGERITCFSARELVKQHKSATQLESSDARSALTTEVTEVTPAHPDNSPVSLLENQPKPELAVVSEVLSNNQSSAITNYVNKHPSEEVVELEAVKKEEHPKQEHSERDKTLVSEDRKIRNQSQSGVKVSTENVILEGIKIKSIEWEKPKPIKKVIQAFVITSSSVKIAAEADPEELTTLLEQMQLHPEFTQDLFRKAKSLADESKL